MKKIAIVGAGPAGLSAAYKLLSHSSEYQVVVFEKDASVGGLSKTYEFEGGRIDVGGHRFFSKDDDVLNLWENILPYDARGMLVRERKSHILWKDKLISYPIQLSLETIRRLGLLTGIHAICSYLCAKVKKGNISSLEDFYIGRFGKKLYSLFFEEYTNKLWGIPAYKLSADWGEQRIHNITIMQLLRTALGQNVDDGKEIRSLITKYRYPALGSGQLWEKLALDITNLRGDIRLGCNIEKINIQDADKIVVEYDNLENKIVESFDYLISSMPLVDLIRAINLVPDVVRDIANKLHYRDMVVVGIELNASQMGEAFKQLREDSWIYIQEPSIAFGRIQILNNWSPHMARNKDSILLELEYFCDKGDVLWRTEDGELIEQAVSELKKMKMCLTSASTISSIVKRIEKAYPIYTDGYYEIEVLKTWLNGITQLQCIGRNGQHKYNNMDHAMLTGFIAAENIIAGDTSREKLWGINGENENHEKGKRI